MKKYVIRHPALTALLVVFLLLSTCGREDALRSRTASRVVITPSLAHLIPGQTLQLSARVEDAGGSALGGQPVVWSSGSALVATVSGRGLVTARGRGRVTITASSGGVSGKIEVTVTDPSVIVVSPSTARLTALGQTVQLAATARLPGGGSVPASDASWTSSDITVASVDSRRGLVKAWGNGTSEVRASVGGASGSSTVTVRQLLSRLRLLGRTGTLIHGDTLQLSAVSLDARNNRIEDLVLQLVWSSSDEAVAVVDSAGLVMAVGSGSASITASAGGKTESRSIRVIPVIPDERAALAALYHAMGGPDWKNNEGWLTSAPISEWHGVFRTDADGRVTSLLLGANGLTGSIPTELAVLDRLEDLSLGVNALTGPIPPELASLARLERLYLSSNQLSGPIPVELAALSKLRVLQLSRNKLTGPIPAELGSLSNLRRLALSSNQLTGPIPSSLGDLSRLERLELEHNRLLGALPLSLEGLEHLSRLYLGVNQLCAPVDVSFQSWLRVKLNVDRRQTPDCHSPDHGALAAFFHAAGGPDWTVSTGWLTSAPLGEWRGVMTDAAGRVAGLSLSGNNLSGGSLETLSSLEHLETLDLSVNALSGALPLSFPALSQMRVLRLSGTGLCAPLESSLQSWLSGLAEASGVLPCASEDRSALAALYRAAGGAGWTRQEGWLSQAPLGTWHGVATDESGTVTSLSLSGNNLSGFVPSELGVLLNLERLDLSSNALSGALPLALARLAHLSHLDMSGTDVCAPSARAFKSWLTGVAYRQVEECPDRDREALVALYRAAGGPGWTSSGGWLTDAPLGHWHGVSANADGRVTGIELERNNLEGAIPAELEILTELRTLKLHSNRLAGAIPGALGNLPDLVYLYLVSNDLEGALPPELARLSGLRELHLGGNELTGSIPPELGRLSGLEVLSLGSNHFEGPIPSGLGRLSNLRHLDLANAFKGSESESAGRVIPPELGDLSRLSALILDRTGLTGGIPPELGRLSNLQGLRLKRNYLSGPIPPELGGLAKLDGLELGRNRLTGPVPPELGDLEWLRGLDLSENDLSGPIPLSFRRLSRLRTLILDKTLLCVPQVPALLAWLEALRDKSMLPACEDADRGILTAFFEASGGPSWTRSGGWLSGLPLSDWAGVRVDSDGRVTGLDLPGNGLSGGLPADLSGLAYLKALDLSGNGLSGPLPPELSDLSRLEVLDLSGNPLTGPLPPALAGLSRLETLDLSFTSLSGPLPLSLARLGALAVLRLEDTGLCALSGEVTSSWLSRIADARVAPCRDQEREILTAFYHATGGPGWKDAAGWLTGAPLGDWLGVTTNDSGAVIALDFSSNDLTGYIPSELGGLENLERLFFSRNYGLGGRIPSELGDLRNLKELVLANCIRTGIIPPELGGLENLERLHIIAAGVDGQIPPELGRLPNLRELAIVSSHDLTGGIPPELGDLPRLEELYIYNNGGMGGTIPSALGRLTTLKGLGIYSMSLEGEIPSSLGGLERLRRLRLFENNLSGLIPASLGSLESLTLLDLHDNALSGPLPPELGSLPAIGTIHLHDNRIGGLIPSSLGGLSTLVSLRLQNNALSGPLPPELGDLRSLKHLWLQDNPDLTGPVPPSLAGVALETLNLTGTGLCAPAGAATREWLESMRDGRVSLCVAPAGVTAYLTQATQSLVNPVPLIAGEAALLRVFAISADVPDGASAPEARAVFHLGGAAAHDLRLPIAAGDLPMAVDEGDLAASVNALIPAEVIEPGLAVQVWIDPDGAGPAGEAASAPPPAPVEVVRVPPLDLTVVPFLWTEDPDRSVLHRTAGLTEGDDLFRSTRDLLPVGAFSVEVREEFWTSMEPIFANRFRLIEETAVLQAADGAGGHYMGVIDGAGLAQRSRYVFLSGLSGRTIAHELGHNMSLKHAPCGPASSYDTEYPYEGGVVGAWGYRFLDDTLIPPHTPDIMGYCSPRWIGDYHFVKALRHRLANPPPVAAAGPAARALLLWGGRSAGGDLVLEPAFAVNAAPWTPPAPGPYRLEGLDAGSRMLFAVSFDMADIAEGEGGVFAFAMPFDPAWAARLSRIVLSGPEGAVAVDDSGETAAALLRDRASGRVRGILRDLPAVSTATATRRTLPEPGLDIAVSRGVPDPADW